MIGFEIGVRLQEEIKEQIEKELGREMTEDEKAICYKASRLGMFKAIEHQTGRRFMNNFNKNNYR